MCSYAFLTLPIVIFAYSNTFSSVPSGVTISEFFCTSCNLQVALNYQRKEVLSHHFFSHSLKLHPSPLQTKEGYGLSPGGLLLTLQILLIARNQFSQIFLIFSYIFVMANASLSITLFLLSATKSPFLVLNQMLFPDQQTQCTIFSLLYHTHFTNICRKIKKKYKKFLFKVQNQSSFHLALPRFSVASQKPFNYLYAMLQKLNTSVISI